MIISELQNLWIDYVKIPEKANSPRWGSSIALGGRVPPIKERKGHKEGEPAVFLRLGFEKRETRRSSANGFFNQAMLL